MAEERLETIREGRLHKREQLIAAGRVPYPAEVRRSHTLGEVTVNFEQLNNDSVPVTLIGRVTAIRRHGGVAFVDVSDATTTFQLQFNRDTNAELFGQLEEFDNGDWIQAAGELAVTTRGQQTLLVGEAHIISKSIRPLPAAHFGLKDHEQRLRQREVDMWLHPQVRDIFTRRSQIMQWLRTFLTTHGFLEVETPILQPLAGGAAARPFATHHNALDMPLYLRIAPELYLKRMVVGGYEKVFELARNFRNEGIDAQHNPEFTMLELYWSYADYEDLMDFSETMLSALVTEVCGSADVVWQGVTLDFATPWPRVRYVEIVSEKLGFDILTEKDPQRYIDVFTTHGLDIPPAPTYAKLVDEIYKELVRPSFVQPTLVYDYPAELQPLAKQSAHDPRVAEQFQLLVGGMEVVKAYTEQNDPVIQRQRFEEQQADRAQGDEEAPPIDETYVRALEYGMPPAGGLGLGIDRVVLLLTDQSHLRDTIAFPLLRSES